VANLDELPTYAGLRKLVEKHDARLQGLRWDYWHCRALGCLAGAAPDRTATQAVSTR
jgi:hypothetical protein